MRINESQFLCTRDFVANDGIHFKKFYCYKGDSTASRESLVLKGELGVSVSFHGGSDYLKRLTYKISTRSDGTAVRAIARHIILANQGGKYILLGVEWEVDGRKTLQLDGQLSAEVDYTIEVRDTKDNNTVKDRSIVKPIKDRVKKVCFK